MINPYMKEAEEIRKAIDTFAANQTDETLIDNMAAFQHWNQNGVYYSAGTLVQDKSKLYHVVQPHTSQSDWSPDRTPALFVEISVEEFPQWKQPTGAHDAYNKGDKVSDEGKHWISNKDGNVYKPGLVSGDWSEVA